MCALEGIGPVRVLYRKVNGKGVMEVGSGGNVPGITGRGACAETGNLDDLQGKPGGRDLWRNTPEDIPGFWLEFDTISA